MTTQLVVPDGEIVTVEYCDPSECPGCPPWPDCDCNRIAASEQNAASGIMIGEAVATSPVKREPAKNSEKWYRHRPKPVKVDSGKNRGQICRQGKRCPSKPIEPVPCMCPLILCAAPSECQC